MAKHKKKNNKIIIFVILIVLLFVTYGIFQTKMQKTIYPKKYSEYVTKYGKEYNVPENLIYATIKAESNFSENAISNKGAKGLMQLMDNTAKDVAKKAGVEVNEENFKEQILNIETNIMLGTKYLSILIQRYENIEVALTAYNAGIGTVDNWVEKGTIKSDGTDIENIPYKETNNYVRKILRDYKIYSNLYSN